MLLTQTFIQGGTVYIQTQDWLRTQGQFHLVSSTALDVDTITDSNEAPAVTARHLLQRMVPWPRESQTTDRIAPLRTLRLFKQLKTNYSESMSSHLVEWETDGGQRGWSISLTSPGVAWGSTLARTNILSAIAKSVALDWDQARIPLLGFTNPVSQCVDHWLAVMAASSDVINTGSWPAVQHHGDIDAFSRDLLAQLRYQVLVDALQAVDMSGGFEGNFQISATHPGVSAAARAWARELLLTLDRVPLGASAWIPDQPLRDAMADPATDNPTRADLGDVAAAMDVEDEVRRSLRLAYDSVSRALTHAVDAIPTMKGLK